MKVEGEDRLLATAEWRVGVGRIFFQNEWKIGTEMLEREMVECIAEYDDLFQGLWAFRSSKVLHVPAAGIYWGCWYWPNNGDDLEQEPPHFHNLTFCAGWCFLYYYFMVYFQGGEQHLVWWQQLEFRLFGSVLRWCVQFLQNFVWQCCYRIPAQIGDEIPDVVLAPSTV